MTPAASILIPTRQRRDYLQLTLESVSVQARAHKAELIILEDDVANAPMQRLVERFGGNYFSNGSHLGLNVTRNRAIAQATSDLLCFLDDDVIVDPCWLESLIAAASRYPDYEVFGGPIVPKLDNRRLHFCGREPLPITALDLGRQDGDAEFVWGANMTLRRSALKRSGNFDNAMSGAGDEEDWQRRFRAAGGRTRYVASAGVEHFRTTADSRLVSLARAARSRGRQARQYDAYKALTPPPLESGGETPASTDPERNMPRLPSVPGEIRTLVGCVFHTFRYRCANGPILAAHTFGRIEEALDPTPLKASLPTTYPDYLSGHSGTLSRRTNLTGAVRDLVAGPHTVNRRRIAYNAAQKGSRRKVLVISVARPENKKTFEKARDELSKSRHHLTVTAEPPLPHHGKWENVNLLLKKHAVEDFDWLLILDDDVELPPPFLDPFLHIAEHFDFKLAQPAHRFRSHAAWPITRRDTSTVARKTRFVEIGPVTALQKTTFDTLIPFPQLKMGWGLDNHWAAVARANGWPIGIVDATPVRHLNPVASTYPRDQALAEAEAFLATRPYVTREEANKADAFYYSLRNTRHVTTSERSHAPEQTPPEIIGTLSANEEKVDERVKS